MDQGLQYKNFPFFIVYARYNNWPIEHTVSYIYVMLFLVDPASDNHFYPGKILFVQE